AQGDNVLVHSHGAHLDQSAGGGGVVSAAVARGVSGGGHGLHAGEVQSGAVCQGQDAAAVGVFRDAGDARPGGGDGGAVLHDFIHGGALQLLHKLAGDLLAAGPDHLVDGGADAVGALLDHLLRALGQGGISHPHCLVGGGLLHLVVIGQLGGNGQLGAVFVQIHGYHLQGTGGDVEPFQQLCHSLAAGLGGDGAAVVRDRDLLSGGQGHVIATLAAGEVHQLRGHLA
ncbi:putative protein conserved in bacteria, partial [Dysosmobacter welbionis]